MQPIRIDRGFHRIAAGQIHYRTAGTCAADGPPPLILAHGGPGSSAGLVPLIAALAETRCVIAPDMMGNGDSDPPPGGVQPEIDFYADCLIELLDGLGLGTFDLYGHHTGAQIACEVAIAHPGRVRRLTLDGLGLFPDDLRQELIEHYAVPITPEASGGHLLKIWEFVDNLTQYFPYYRCDDDHRIVPFLPMPPVAAMNIAREVIKAWPTVHIAYRAAFAHRLSERLPLVIAPALVLETDGDPLARYARDAAILLNDGHHIRVTRAERAVAIADWLVTDQRAANEILD